MNRGFKLIWTDEGNTKTALGSGFDIITGSAGILVEFHGYEGDILLTPNSFGGQWAIK